MVSVIFNTRKSFHKQTMHNNDFKSFDPTKHHVTVELKLHKQELMFLIYQLKLVKREVLLGVLLLQLPLICPCLFIVSYFIILCLWSLIKITFCYVIPFLFVHNAIDLYVLFVRLLLIGIKTLFSHLIMSLIIGYIIPI